MFGASACLVGLNTRFDGANKLDASIHRLFVEGKIIPLCPEQLGGLSTPRLRAEIAEGSGEDVLDGKSAVILEDGTDMTLQFLRGANEVLRIVNELGIRRFYMKTKSPSCGVGKIYVNGKLQKGNGVCAALLLREGIELIPV
ncbi:DUF523 domain-containing protein [Candidatus Poribacteria bacterium]|nr:DUF523 domain-containing protein [Candidatus Poribacteria bacterium]